MQETVAYPRHNTNVSSMVFKKIEKWYYQYKGYGTKRSEQINEYWCVRPE